MMRSVIAGIAGALIAFGGGGSAAQDRSGAAPAANAAAKPVIDEIGLDGSIGPYPIGAHMTVKDHRVFVAGHYFYARHPIDIDLSGAIRGETLTLRGTDGSTFDLHFESADRTAPRPLTFYTSTALVGTWTKGAARFPVRLGIDLVGGPQGTARYADVTSEPAPAFEARVRRFLQGALTGDKAAVAATTSFPLNVGNTRRSVIRSRQDLYARWTQIFTPCLLARLKQAVPHEMFVRNGLAMVSNGTVWFDAKGATSLNIPTCR